MHQGLSLHTDSILLSPGQLCLCLHMSWFLRTLLCTGPTSWDTSILTLQINGIIFYPPSSGILRRECLLSVSFLKLWFRGYGQGYFAATHWSGVWVRGTAGQTMENKSHLKHHLETCYTPCNQNNGNFPSYFPCRNKDLYHSSSFVIIFNVVSNISFRWRWLNLNISPSRPLPPPELM